jgi:hypothetical protein
LTYYYNYRHPYARAGRGRRLLQLLCTVPATATGKDAWVLRFGEK